jgi:hypothetical protein
MSYFKGIGRKSGSYTGRKLPLVGLLENKKHTIFNEYVPGSSVGASSVVTRRLKKQRARIKKCTPPEPILPELDENEYFEISDDITTFNSILEDQINALDLEMTYNLRTDENISVDRQTLKVVAVNHINALLEDPDRKSLTFSIISEINPNDISNDKFVINIDELLSSDDYNITISEPTTVQESSSSDISQHSTHTLLYKGNSDGKPNIEYVMTITEFIPLQ